MSLLSERASKEILSRLPAKRKNAGKKSHLKVYKKLLRFKNTHKLLKFLDINHPCPSKGSFKLFIEVALGNRISDCVLLLTWGENRICYIVELKTCMSHQVDMLQDIRRAQKSQGLYQLCDAVRFVQNSAPAGRQKWTIVPHLVFKTQDALKTIHSETPTFMTNLIHSCGHKLSQFLASREDFELKRRLSCLNVTKSKSVAPKHCLLGSQPHQYSHHKQRLIARNKKKCFQSQKGCN
ncbi:hypothetical protein KM481_gp16 [Harp seal herpesvirus]|uniref:Protein UL24 homolog n=1 Tax=phocid gammaherpesvirus 3 TaxID=2560643 RepID=A0A0R5WUP1_9GAMA|nr:hypothetical protein KM481_gp16 [Harp seal herpesvirus]AJG42946.1 hypothetical protein [Harp seal herpesvirus]